jgi:hypothetical protein
MIPLRYLLLATMTYAAIPASADALHDRLASDGVVASVTWQTASEDLLCVATKNDPGETNKIRCYTKSKTAPIASIEIEPGLIQLQVLGLVDGPLIASWGTGSGFAYAAYAYRNGAVKKIWDSGSFMPFESFWADAQGEYLVLALPEPSWIDINGEKEKVAGTATLLLWKDSTFIELGTSPWKDRLQVATTRVESRNKRK